MISSTLGGYVVLGSRIKPPLLERQVYLVRTDINGDTLWTSTHQLNLVPNIYYGDIVEDSAGGFIAGISGDYSSGPSINREAVLIRFNQVGDTLWTKKMGGIGDDSFYQIKNAHDGNFLVNVAINDTSHLVKIDANGNEIWNRIYRYNSTRLAYINNIGIFPGSYHLFMVGHTSLPYQLITINEQGDSVSSVYGPMPQVIKVILTSDNYYLATDGGYLYKLTMDGDTLWRKLYTVGGPLGTGIVSMVEEADGTYACLGQAFSFSNDNNFVVLKIDTSGTLLNYSVLISSSEETATDITLSPDGDYVICGTSDFLNPFVDHSIFLGELKRWAYLTSPAELQEYFSGYQVYPNPTKDFVELSGFSPITGNISLHDLSGRTLGSLKASGQPYVRFSLSEFPTGLYILNYLDEGGLNHTYKIVKN